MPQLNYLAQVVPPSLTADHFSRFDAGVADLVLQAQLMTLSGECISPVCADARLAAFKMRLRLPLRFNGAGLIGVDALQGDDDAKVSLVLDWLRAPSMVLVPFLQSSANHSPELKAFLARLADDGNPLATRDDESADARRVRACSRRLKWGQRAKALRTLLSPGVANEHPRAEAIMRDMHPSPRRQVTPPADLPYGPWPPGYDGPCCQGARCFALHGPHCDGLLWLER